MMNHNGSGNRLIIGFLIGAAVVALVVAGLIAWEKDMRERELGTPGNPVVFMLSREHGKNLSLEDRGIMAEFLERESGMHFEVLIASSPLEAIESFGSRSDVGILNLFEFMLARKEYGVDAALRIVRTGGSTSYSGAVVVNRASPHKTVADLSGVAFAYADPFSTSGFVFPAKLLRSSMVEVSAIFAGGHTEALALLKSGKVEAAATFMEAALSDSALRIIAATDSIPNEPVIVRGDMRMDKRERITAALLKFKNTPDGARILDVIANIKDFAPANNSDYDPVLGVIKSAGATVYDLVPEGIQVESRRRGIELVI